ncbi:MAG: 3-dehydroquinate synthase [Pseudomonadota bacterium]
MTNPFQQTGYELEVELGTRSYPLLIAPGVLAKSGILLREMKPKAQAFVVTDRTVEKLHAEKLLRFLTDQGINVVIAVIDPGEHSKNFLTLQDLVNQIIDAGIERGDVVIAFGGGVVGDLAGFAAAVTLRGIDFVQIPTTLLAQVDSSVGGKTGINTKHGKNLVGAFHQPRLVLVDTDLLDTLDARQMRAGYAEIVKMALINDPAFFNWLESVGAKVFENTPERAQAIYNACRRKAEIVARDEREAGERMLLNLGHTFAHALEAMTGYSDALLHGEAVAIGTAMAFRFSTSLGLCKKEDTQRVEAHLKAHGLIISPKGLKNVEAGAFLKAMKKDKKTAQGQFTLILARGIGEAFVSRDVKEAQLAAFLQNETAVA